MLRKKRREEFVTVHLSGKKPVDKIEDDFNTSPTNNFFFKDNIPIIFFVL
jgi:hypothetical protein